MIKMSWIIGIVAVIALVLVAWNYGVLDSVLDSQPEGTITVTEWHELHSTFYDGEVTRIYGEVMRIDGTLPLAVLEDVGGSSFVLTIDIDSNNPLNIGDKVIVIYRNNWDGYLYSHDLISYEVV